MRFFHQGEPCRRAKPAKKPSSRHRAKPDSIFDSKALPFKDECFCFLTYPKSILIESF